MLPQINPTTLTMSSREIADLCDKEHRNVMRDIRAMLVELHGEGGLLNFEHTQHNPQNGQHYPIFRLPKREALILVSGYRTDIRAKIIDRWMELEAEAAPPALTSELDRLRQRVDRLEGANHSGDDATRYSFDNAAIMLRITADKLKLEILSRKWAWLRRDGSLSIAPATLDAGLLTYNDQKKRSVCLTGRGLRALGRQPGAAIPASMQTIEHVPVKRRKPQAQRSKEYRDRKYKLISRLRQVGQPIDCRASLGTIVSLCHLNNVEWTDLIPEKSALLPLWPRRTP